MPIHIPDKVFFRIGEVARLLGVKTHVLRYWESEFPMLAPRKSPSNQRVYRRGEVEALVVIRRLLYEEKYSIAGAREKVRGSSMRRLRSEAPRDRSSRLQMLATELERLANQSISELFHF